MTALLPRDRARLEGVHRDLVRVVERARLAVPFIVTEGLRSRERQTRLVAIGASRTMNSIPVARAYQPRNGTRFISSLSRKRSGTGIARNSAALSITDWWLATNR